MTESEVEAVKKYVINPVESREATMDKFDTLKAEYTVPETVETLHGFNDLDADGLANFVKNYALAMDADDIKFCQDYFKSENKTPTITEIRMIDTYWSDHCRHTTFLTTIDSVKFDDPLLQSAYDEYVAVRQELGRTKPVNLMDIATVGTRYLKAKGKLPRIDESEEINACTVKSRLMLKAKNRIGFFSSRTKLITIPQKSSLSAVLQLVSAVLSVTPFQAVHMSTQQCV